MRRLLTILILLLLVQSAMAFNGEKRGFVFGLSVGYSPYASWSFDETGEYTYFGFGKFDESNSGPAAGFLFGFIWDERNMLVYESEVVGILESDFFTNQIDRTAFDLEDISSKQKLFQRTATISWYHYYGNSGRRFFTDIGLGLYLFHKDDFGINNTGAAVKLGGGYELNKYLQVGANFSFGRTPDYVIDFKHYQFSLMLTGMINVGM